MNAQLLELWTKVLIFLEDKISPVGYESWIKNIRPENITTEELTLRVDTLIMKSMIEQRYVSLIKEALFDIKQKVYEIKVLANEEMSEEETIIEETPENKKEDNNSILSKFTFENFVIGSGNRFAQAASYAVAQQPAIAHNPLFMYGGVGLGKTHLMMAIGNYIKQHDPSKKVLYISAENFTSEMVDAVQTQKMKEFREKFRSIDVLLVDDIQFIAKGEKSAEEFFHTFEFLYQSNKQIVLTCDSAPNEMIRVAERLKSRFSWGIVCRIDPPDYETRIAILKQKAEENKIIIPDEVLFFIAENISNNIRELEGVLNRIISYHSLLNQDITLDLAKESVKGFQKGNGPKEINPALIIECCSRYFRVSTDDILSQKKTKEIVIARRVAMYLCREELGLSHPKIAKIFNKKDHTTIIYACDKAKEAYDKGDVIKYAIDTLKKDIYQK